MKPCRVPSRGIFYGDFVSAAWELPGFDDLPAGLNGAKTLQEICIGKIQFRRLIGRFIGTGYSLKNQTSVQLNCLYDQNVTINELFDILVTSSILPTTLSDSNQDQV